VSEGSWPVVPLGELIETIEAGSSFRCRETPPDQGEVGVAKVSAVSWGRYDEQESKTCLDPNRINHDLLIRKGDFLISRANTVELVGACVIAQQVRKQVMLSDKTLRIQFKDSSLKPWVLHFLRSRAGREQIEALCTGNQESMRNISQRSLRQIELPLAPPEQRQEILSFIDQQLSRADATTTTLQAIQGKLKHARASILKAAVEGRLVETEAELAEREGRGFESGTQLLARHLEERRHRRVAGAQSGGRRKNADPCQPGNLALHPLPNGWTIATIDQLADGSEQCLTDGPFGSNLTSLHYKAGGPRVIRLQNIGDGIFKDERAHISEEHFASLKKHAVNGGDIVIASLGDVLPRSCIIPLGLGSAIVKADCIRFSLDRTNSRAAYINYALNSPPIRRGVADLVHGVGRTRLGLKGIREICIPLPPLSEQCRIVVEVDRRFSVLDEVEDTVNASLRRCNQLRQAILQRTFMH
jgi:type I restriction enzyme S subunit